MIRTVIVSSLLSSAMGALVATLLITNVVRAEQRDGRTPLTNSFSYQGRLDLDGIDANGAFDFQFLLYDSPQVGTGAQVGTTIEVDDLAVSGGLFSLQLDFGSAPFTGQQRYLEVRTRPGAETSGFVIVGRQELTATPYALYAKAIPLAGNGISTSAARSDHHHLGQTWTDSGPLRLQPGAAAALIASSSITGGQPTIHSENTSDGTGVFGRSMNGDGLSGLSIFGRGVTAVRGSCPFGVQAAALFACSSGLSVSAISHSGAAVVASSWFGGDALIATGSSGYAGILGYSRNGANTNWGGYFVGHVGVEGSLSHNSDARLKENIESVDAALALVSRLRPVSFEWRSGDAGRHLGFTAQEVQEVLPELVTEGKNGNLMVDYTGLIPLLVRAIQEQQAQIDLLSQQQN